MDQDEAARRLTNTARLEAYFKANEGLWIDSRILEKAGGRNAWRTRVSECRVKRHMNIENKQERLKTEDGFAVLSFYRYLSYQPLGPDASAYRTQPRLIP